MLDKFLHGDTMGMRLARTIVQGLLAVLIVAVPMLVGYANLPAEAASVLTAAIMAVLSPIMAAIKTGNPEDAIEEEQ